ncbi:MAG: tyrosine-type recombinase/integrase [Pseudomonadota bacterium]
MSRHDKVGSTTLSPQSAALIVKAAVCRVGVDAAIVSGHSLRAGYVTTAAEAGLQPHQIQETTGHRSHEMLARYIRASGEAQDSEHYFGADGGASNYGITASQSVD